MWICGDCYIGNHEPVADNNSNVEIKNCDFGPNNKAIPRTTSFASVSASYCGAKHRSAWCYDRANDEGTIFSHGEHGFNPCRAHHVLHKGDVANAEEVLTLAMLF